MIYVNPAITLCCSSNYFLEYPHFTSQVVTCFYLKKRFPVRKLSTTSFLIIDIPVCYSYSVFGDWVLPLIPLLRWLLTGDFSSGKLDSLILMNGLSSLHFTS